MPVKGPPLHKSGSLSSRLSACLSLYQSARSGANRPFTYTNTPLRSFPSSISAFMSKHHFKQATFVTDPSGIMLGSYSFDSEVTETVHAFTSNGDFGVFKTCLDARNFILNQLDSPENTPPQQVVTPDVLE